MTWLIITGLVLAGALAIYPLMKALTARGGMSDRDATDLAGQILAEADALRGSRSHDTVPWDGESRLARPDQDLSGFHG